MAERPLGFRALLGDEGWARLLMLGTHREFASGTYLMRQGEPGGYLVALVSGRVKVLGHTPDGDELLVSLRSAGDVVGEMATGEHSRRTVSVMAIDRCIAKVIETHRFHRFLEENRAVGRYTNYLILKLSQTIPSQMQLARFPAERRVARLLHELVTLAPPDKPDRFLIPLSQGSWRVPSGWPAAPSPSRSPCCAVPARSRPGGASWWPTCGSFADMRDCDVIHTTICPVVDNAGRVSARSSLATSRSSHREG